MLATWLFAWSLSHDYNAGVRKATGQILRLKHHPFPFRDKDKKEYIIGEALVRWQGMSEDEVATLRKVEFDPPDLIFGTDDFGGIRVEITESVPYDRDSEAKSWYFVKRLKASLRGLGTRPPKPSNVFVSREPFGFPSIRPREIEDIAVQIDRFFKTTDFGAKYEMMQEIVAAPMSISFIPALGAFAYPLEHYDDNLLVRDITGYSLDKKEIERSFKAIIVRKSCSEMKADILIIFQGTIGIVGMDEGSLRQVKNRLTADLAYRGIYIVEIIPFPSDYWVNVMAIREHPLFERRSVKVDRQ